MTCSVGNWFIAAVKGNQIWKCMYMMASCKNLFDRHADIILDDLTQVLSSMCRAELDAVVGNLAASA